MDANGTRYHLLLGHADWAACLDERGQPLATDWIASPVVHNASGLEWHAAQQELTLQARVFQFDTSPFDDKLTLERRRGAACDGYGNWYWIAESGVELRVQSAGTSRSAHFWSAGDGVRCETPPRFGAFSPHDTPSPSQPLSSLSGLAITEDHYLIVGVLHPKGLLIFDLHATSAPRQVFWPEDVPFRPFDMAPRLGGGVWILDRENKCYWGLDRKFNVLRLTPAVETLKAEDFQPLAGNPVRRTATQPFPDAITFEAAAPLDVHDPIAIATLPDDTVLILDNAPGEKFSRLSRYRLHEALGSASLAAVCAVVDEAVKSTFHLIGYDLAFVPENNSPPSGRLGTAFVAAFNGNQTYAFEVFQAPGDGHPLELQALARYYPMRLFGGKAIVAEGDQVYYDFGERWLPLVEQKRPRYETEATFFTPMEQAAVFDGRQPDCVWHRLLLEACLPPDSAVQIWSRTTNELEQLPRVAWQPEPKLHRRAEGSELPFAPPPKSVDAGTWEVLFQRARGRYLQLKITLNGNGRSTPRLHALRAYYPRFSYLEHYLPAVYREDKASASFLDRFLANTEGTLTTVEDKIAAVQMLFDVRSAPAETLEWLAGWFGVALDPAWDERRRRLFIRHALDFFQYRGTLRGLLLALHLALDTCVDETIFTQPLTFSATRPSSKRQGRLTPFRIIEKFRTRQTPRVVLGDPTETAGLRVVTVTTRWDPTQGRDTLNQRWRAASASITDYPIRDPGHGQSGAWRAFTQATLGFLPVSDVTRDRNAWQEFLSQRYETRQALNTAYGLPVSGHSTSFTDIPLPTALPHDHAPLVDWYEFEGTVLPMQSTAHCFTVMLPAPARLTEAQHQEWLEIAQRVINFEKPAHTQFDVKFYWAMFRLGEARLGEDTLIDQGSRAPGLMPPFVLGRDYLSEGYLAPSHPQNVPDRLVLDRDRLTNDESRPPHI